MSDTTVLVQAIQAAEERVRLAVEEEFTKLRGLGLHASRIDIETLGFTHATRRTTRIDKVTAVRIKVEL